MKHKLIKTRDRFGMPVYEPMVDMDGIIAVTRRILEDDPTNPRAYLFIQWIDSLDHKPTNAEFEAWVTSKGVILTKAVTEDYEN